MESQKYGVKYRKIGLKSFGDSQWGGGTKDPCFLFSAYVVQIF